jgi:hypothetical protein
LDARNQPDQSEIGQACVRITSSDIGVNPAEPILFDMTSRFVASRNGPERRNEWPPSLVDANGVQSYVNMVAEAGVVESKEQNCNVTRERRESYSIRRAAAIASI